MKRYFPWLVLVLAAAWIAADWRVPRVLQDSFDIAKFGKTPVLVGGRVKPLDTVARNALLIIHGKQQLRLEGGGQLTAMEWLTDTMFNASVFGFRFSFAALILDLMFCVSQHADRNCYYIS
jgi:hypothetical protein